MNFDFKIRDQIFLLYHILLDAKIRRLLRIGLVKRLGNLLFSIVRVLPII